MDDHKGKGKSTQPVQFSFTLYDLDGHGKITKDDIAGIVSTIYESLGKSVVVPHYGSKTINVRLTVSPDSSQNTAATAAVQSKSAQPAADKSKKLVTPRRRYRPRKLMSDDENSDSSNELLNHKNCMSPHSKGHGPNTNKTHKANKGSPMKSPLKEFSVMAPVATVAPILTTPTLTETNLINLKTPTNSIYMNLQDGHALYDTPKHPLKVVATPEIIVSPYHEPAAATELSMMARHQQMLLQQKEQRKKLLRKTRSRKQKVSEAVELHKNPQTNASFCSLLVSGNGAHCPCPESLRGQRAALEENVASCGSSAGHRCHAGHRDERRRGVVRRGGPAERSGQLEPDRCRGQERRRVLEEFAEA